MNKKDNKDILESLGYRFAKKCLDIFTVKNYFEIKTSLSENKIRNLF